MAQVKRTRGQKSLEATLWEAEAADKLRGNLEAAEYKHVVLGLVFLKYVSDAFTTRRLSHAREYHNTSRAVRQTSSKPREDSESDTSPASPFGGTATRSIYRERRSSIRLGDERPPVRALHATRPVSTVRCKCKRPLAN